MFKDEGTLRALTGGYRVKPRVQHPKVLERKCRDGWHWFFRYYQEEVQPDGLVKTVRPFHALGPSRGPDRMTKDQAQVERDKILMKLNTTTVQQVVVRGIALFGEVAKMYKESYLHRHVSEPTREKEESHLDLHIVPKWGARRLNEINPKEVEDWLFQNWPDSWWTRHAMRYIMGRVYKKAEEWMLWEENRRNPLQKVKIGQKSWKRPRMILTMEQTAQVLAQLEEPILPHV
jgi:hypothetical protein